MALSMTGFSFKEADTQQGILLLEFRSLNNRYLDLQVKLAESLRSFDPMIRDLISTENKRCKGSRSLVLTWREGQTSPRAL